MSTFLHQLNILSNVKPLAKWRKREWSDQAPSFVKEAVFSKYAIPDATWVETGTFQGQTTRYLAAMSRMVYTIEPADQYYNAAVEAFKGTHVEPIHGTSETVMPDLMPRLSGDVCFWLDGHFSGGDTFHGLSECPVEDELAAIDAHLERLGKISILIDDIRCFPSRADPQSDYPSVDLLVDWARAHDFEWRIEHDIFIMRNWS